MRTCTVEKFNPDVSKEELQKEFDFCHSLKEKVTNGFYWPSILMETTTLEEFKEKLEIVANAKGGFAPGVDLKDIVPQDSWWVKNENDEIIGIAKTRYLLSGKLLQNGGHIGAGLKEEFRGKGYGTKLLSVLLDEYEKRGIYDVLVHAHTDNAASQITIKKNGGKFWNTITLEPKGFRETFLAPPKRVSRYWISLG